MKKAVNILNSLEDYILAVMLLVMTVLAFVNVVARYVFLAGAAVALKNHSHLGLSIITDHLSPKGRKIAGLFGCVCGVFFCAVAIYYGVLMTVKEHANNVLTQGMQWPEYLFGMWLPIGCAVLCIRFIQWAVYLLTDRDFTDTGREVSNE